MELCNETISIEFVESGKEEVLCCSRLAGHAEEHRCYIWWSEE